MAGRGGGEGGCFSDGWASFLSGEGYPMGAIGFDGCGRWGLEKNVK